MMHYVEHVVTSFCDLICKYKNSSRKVLQENFTYFGLVLVNHFLQRNSKKNFVTEIAYEWFRIEKRLVYV